MAEPVAGSYVLDVLKAAITDSETGYLDLGSGPEAIEYEQRLLQHPAIKNEIHCQTREKVTSWFSAKMPFAAAIDGGFAAIFRLEL